MDTLLQWQEMDGFIPMQFIPFCSDAAGDDFYICVDEEEYGKVYYFFSEFVNDFLKMPGHGLIANSFQEFLDKIVPLV